jgi:hypothetical protein
VAVFIDDLQAAGAGRLAQALELQPIEAHLEIADFGIDAGFSEDEGVRSSPSSEQLAALAQGRNTITKARRTQAAEGSAKGIEASVGEIVAAAIMQAVGDAAELGRGQRMGLIGLGEAGCLPGALAAVDLPGAGLVSAELAGAKPGARVPVQGVALITTDLGSIGHGHAMQHLATFPQQFCGNGTEFRPDMSRYACCWGRSHIC